MFAKLSGNFSNDSARGEAPLLLCCCPAAGRQSEGCISRRRPKTDRVVLVGGEEVTSEMFCYYRPSTLICKSAYPNVIPRRRRRSPDWGRRRRRRGSDSFRTLSPEITLPLLVTLCARCLCNSSTYWPRTSRKNFGFNRTGHSRTLRTKGKSIKLLPIYLVVHSRCGCCCSCVWIFSCILRSP